MNMAYLPPYQSSWLDGDLITEKGGWPGLCLPFVEGGMLGTDEESLKSLGENLARLHQIPTADCFPDDYRMGWSLFEEMFEIADDTNTWSDFLITLKKESESLREPNSSGFTTGYFAWRCVSDNVIGDGSVAAILDLEEAFIGPCAFDLMMAFVGFGWDDEEPLIERWNALLEGYESIRPLTQDEKLALPALHRYATLSIAAWRYWKHVMTQPDDALKGRYLEMVNRLEIGFDF